MTVPLIDEHTIGWKYKNVSFSMTLIQNNVENVPRVVLMAITKKSGVLRLDLTLDKFIKLLKYSSVGDR